MLFLTNKSGEKKFPDLKREDKEIQQCVNCVKEEINELQQVQIAAFGTGDDGARSKYVFGILKQVMLAFSITKIGISIEHLYGNDWGLVKYVLTPRDPKLVEYPVGFIIEIQKENFDQGIALFSFFFIFFYLFLFIYFL